MSEHSAYIALTSLAALSRRSARGLPAQINVVPRWSGVGFSFMGNRYVAPMGQMSELLEVPISTKLPGVQPWVIGLSNVRGRLLPLFDLSRFFGGTISGQKKNHRVLVLETENLYSGIVVDRAFGMQHFAADRFGPTEADIKDDVQPFVKGAYRDSRGEQWSVFNLISLAEDARFLNAALV
jgi:twitching motility protein PilI